METVLTWLLAVGVAVCVLILLGIVVRARFTSGVPRPSGAAARVRPGEHAATHHAIWLPIGQELGLDLTAEADGPATRLGMRGTRREVPLTLDVRIPWAVHARIWQALGEPQGAAGLEDVPDDALSDLRLEVSVPMPAPMPAGLRVGPKTGPGPTRSYLGAHEVQTGDPRLDDQVRVRSEDRAAARALVMDPRVRTALARLARLGQPFTWTEQAVALTVHPHRVARFRPIQAKEYVDACAGLGAAARARQWAPWGRLAQELGLTREGGSLQGLVDGVRVRIEPRFDQAAAELEVGRALRPLRLAAHDPGGKGAPIKFPTPALGASLSGRTQDKFLARRILSDPATAAALVEVLEGTEGAALIDGVLRLPIRAGADAAPTLRRAVGLARRLVRAAR